MCLIIFFSSFSHLRAFEGGFGPIKKPNVRTEEEKNTTTDDPLTNAMNDVFKECQSVNISARLWFDLPTLEEEIKEVREAVKAKEPIGEYANLPNGILDEIELLEQYFSELLEKYERFCSYIKERIIEKGRIETFKLVSEIGYCDTLDYLCRIEK